MLGAGWTVQGLGEHQDELLRRDFARSVKQVGDTMQASGSSDESNIIAQMPIDSEGGGPDWNPNPVGIGEQNLVEANVESNEFPNNGQDEESMSLESTLSWLKESFIRVTERVVSANPVYGGPPDASTVQQGTNQVADSYYSDLFRASQGVEVFDDSDNNFDSVPRTPLGLTGVNSASSDSPSVASFG